MQSKNNEIVKGNNKKEERKYFTNSEILRMIFLFNFLIISFLIISGLLTTLFYYFFPSFINKEGYVNCNDYRSCLIFHYDNINYYFSYVQSAIIYLKWLLGYQI